MDNINQDPRLDMFKQGLLLDVNSKIHTEGDKKTAAELDKTSQTGDKKIVIKLKPPTNNDNPKMKKSRQQRKSIETEPPGKVRKIDEMFNRIKNNAAQPQSVGLNHETL